MESVLLIEPTGNRPDLLSVYGLAREVAALYDLPLAALPGAEPEPAGTSPSTSRSRTSRAAPGTSAVSFATSRRAVARLAAMPPATPASDLERRRRHQLRDARARQPLHAFDFDTLAGGRIVVRRARPGSARTLDGAERELTPEDLMIADAERSVALAGIMGGEETEISEATKTVLLEAANFEPVGIFRSSERLRLRTDGSNRWEKGVDPHLAGRPPALRHSCWWS